MQTSNAFFKVRVIDIVGNPVLYFHFIIFQYLINFKFLFSSSRILIAEAYTDSNHTFMYYGNPGYNIAHFPFNFVFVGLKTFPSPKSMDGQIKYWLMNMPKNGVPNWQVSVIKVYLILFIPRN